VVPTLELTLFLLKNFRLFVLSAYNNFVQEHRDEHSNG